MADLLRSSSEKAYLGQVRLKTGGKCPNSKCLDDGHLAEWILWVIIHIDELAETMAFWTTRKIVLNVQTQCCGNTTFYTIFCEIMLLLSDLALAHYFISITKFIKKWTITHLNQWVVVINMFLNVAMPNSCIYFLVFPYFQGS